jgi:plasmid stabilization system protein ParE
MAYSLIITDTAHDDVDQIVGYIALRLRNPSAAKNLLDQIAELYQKLELHPEMFPLAKDERIAAKGFRIAPLERYITAYKVDTASKKVIIHVVFYGARTYHEFL